MIEAGTVSHVFRFMPLYLATVHVPPPEVPVNVIHRNGHTSGQSCHGSDQALPVRFSCGFKAKHGIFYGSNNRPES